MKEFFVVFEGTDKIGKSTLIKKVFKEIKERAKDWAVLQTRQPIINLERNSSSEEPLKPLFGDSVAQTLFFLLDRKINLNWIKEWSKENSKKNRIILCDRYFYSTFVYQGDQKPKSIENIISLHKLSDTWRVPDCVFFLKGEEKVFQNRHKNLMKKTFFDIFERKEPKFFSFNCLCCQTDFFSITGRTLREQRKNLVSDCVLNLFPKRGYYDFLEIDGSDSPLKTQEKYEKVFSFFQKKHKHNIFTIQIKGCVDAVSRRVSEKIIKLFLKK